MRLETRLVVALLAASLPFVGCKGEEDQSAGAAAPPGASRCTRGLARAAKAPTEQESTAIYYEECAEMFSQAACRDQWRAAAKLPVSEQVSHVADACRKAYCPSLKAFSFDICRDDFAATPEALLKGWPPLFDAIIAKEAGSATQEVSSSMLVLYAHLKQIAPAPAPSSEEPSGSASAGAPAAPPSSGAPATSASAGAPKGPTAPAGSAHGSVVDKAAKPKKPAASPKQ